MSVIAETTLIWTHVLLETVVGDQSHERYLVTDTVQIIIWSKRDTY